ncbi:hypothetical protein ABZX39_36725 [Streptomyces collinus]|uniref:hypothetical protein n=1 Tax=Streptomyces collinus TaxID=42684 RepID=UPI0033B84D01
MPLPTALLFDRSGELRASHRTIHRYGFDTGEATTTGGGRDVVTVAAEFGVIGLAVCRDLPLPRPSGPCSTKPRS